ncbi:MAG: alanine racemase [Candidatus Saccharibacteria bacterium]
MLQTNYSPLSYVEISKSRLLSNIEHVRSYISPNTKIAAVVKGDAYGHGQNEVAAIINNYVDYFQVDDLCELRSLRDVVSKPILVLGYIVKSEIREAIESNAIIAIYDNERLELIDQIAGELNVKAKIHIKIDACLGRQGLLATDIPDFIDECKKCENIEFDGIYSHFANIEDTDDPSHTQAQIKTFKNAVELFKSAGFDDLKTHISATSGILVYDKNLNENNIVRLGIGLYGLWPSENLKNNYLNELKLEPVMRWITHVAQVKVLPANYTIGYGLTYVTDKPTKVAVIPQGYSDGYDRGLSNCGEVLIRGVRCKVLGRVAMNMFVVDVSKLDQVAVEDEVVLLGWQGNESISAEELALKIDTINYEITTRISALLPRIVV